VIKECVYDNRENIRWTIKNIGVYILREKEIRESDMIDVICWWFDRKRGGDKIICWMNIR